jgi:hypothetical protein
VRHLERVRRQHFADLQRRAGWIEMPDALARKYLKAESGTGSRSFSPRGSMIYTHVLYRGPAAVRSPADQVFGR